MMESIAHTAAECTLGLWSNSDSLHLLSGSIHCLKKNEEMHSAARIYGWTSSLLLIGGTQQTATRSKHFHTWRGAPTWGNFLCSPQSLRETRPAQTFPDVPDIFLCRKDHFLRESTQCRVVPRCLLAKCCRCSLIDPGSTFGFSSGPSHTHRLTAFV